MSDAQASWRSRLAVPGLAALLVACCLAAPLIIGAAGALTLGALFGIGVAAIALLALCLFAANRLRSDKGC